MLIVLVNSRAGVRDYHVCACVTYVNLLMAVLCPLHTRMIRSYPLPAFLPPFPLWFVQFENKQSSNLKNVVFILFYGHRHVSAIRELIFCYV